LEKEVMKAPKSIAYHEPKRVTIEKASNGFTVSTYTGNGTKLMVAKSSKEAVSAAKKLLGK
jgi:hypothetical protein